MEKKKKFKYRSIKLTSLIYSYVPSFYYEKGVIHNIQLICCPNNFEADRCVVVEVTIGTHENSVTCSGIFTQEKALHIFNELIESDTEIKKLEQLINQCNGLKVVVRVDQHLRLDRIYREEQFSD